MTLFGERLKALRIRDGVSLLDFSNGVNKSYATVNKWEKGEIFPSEDSLLAIAEYYGLSHAALLSYLTDENDSPLIKDIKPRFIEDSFVLDESAEGLKNKKNKTSARKKVKRNALYTLAACLLVAYFDMLYFYGTLDSGYDAVNNCLYDAFLTQTLFLILSAVCASILFTFIAERIKSAAIKK